jgi:thiol-disulfide isomerase/thioredoxin
MRSAPTLVAVAAALLAAGCGATAATDDSTDAAGAAVGQTPAATAPVSPSAPPTEGEPTETSAPTPDEAPAAGAWVDQAAYEADKAAFHAAGDVVLFFNASWCPTCQQTVRALDEQGAPPGLTVVSVDYDSADALRQQYQVTVQHTFVQVDEAGQPMAKFTGSLTGAEIAGQTA